MLQTSKKNKYIYSWKKSMLIVETIYSTEEKRNTIDHSHTVHRSIYSYKLMFVRKKNYLPKNEETEWLFLLYIKKKKNFQEVETKRRKENRDRRCTLKRKRYIKKNKKKKVCIQDYFLRIRADDDRPVSVPVGSCCLELFDADCDGCICWISLEVRRYTPTMKKPSFSKNKN